MCPSDYQADIALILMYLSDHILLQSDSLSTDNQGSDRADEAAERSSSDTSVTHLPCASVSADLKLLKECRGKHKSVEMVSGNEYSFC